jgi:hypothetical protein
VLVKGEKLVPHQVWHVYTRIGVVPLRVLLHYHQHLAAMVQGSLDNSVCTYSASA